MFNPIFEKNQISQIETKKFWFRTKNRIFQLETRFKKFWFRTKKSDFSDRNN